MRSLLIGMFIVLVATVSAHSAELSVPTVDEFKKLPYYVQSKIILKLSGIAGSKITNREEWHKHRSPPLMKDNWQPPENWTPLLTYLSQTPLENPKLVRLTGKLMNVLPGDKKVIVDFCRNLYSPKDKMDQLYLADELLARHTMKDEALLKQCVDSAFDNPASRNLVCVAQRHRASQILKKRLFYWSEPERTQSQKATAIGLLPCLDLTGPECGLVCRRFLKSLSSLPRQKALQLSASFVRQIKKNASVFHRRLDNETVPLLTSSPLHKDKAFSKTLHLLLLLGSQKVSTDLCWKLLEKQDEPGFDAVGFLPSRPMSTSELTRLTHAIAKARTSSRPGLFSLYWRCGGHQNLMNNKRFRLPSAYLHAFGVGRTSGLPRREWRPSWNNKSKILRDSLRPEVVASVAHDPNCASAIWVLEQAIQTDKLSWDILNTLWKVRKSGKGLAKAKGLRDWLNSVYARPAPPKVLPGTIPQPEAAMIVSGVIWHFYGDCGPFDKLLEKLRKEDASALHSWTRLTPLLFEVEKQEGTLEAFIDAYGKRVAAGVSGNGKAWRLWLLKLRAGRKVGSPPIRSLSVAVRGARSWVELLLESGDGAFPWLPELRSVCVPLQIEFDARSGLHSYLGTLDQLERLKRKAGK